MVKCGKNCKRNILVIEKHVKSRKIDDRKTKVCFKIYCKLITSDQKIANKEILFVLGVCSKQDHSVISC